VAVRHSTEGAPPQGGDIEVVYADVRDGGTVAQAVRDSDAVVNAVGLYVPQGKATFQAVHVDGAQEVPRPAKAAGIPRLVHISGIGAAVPAGVMAHVLEIAGLTVGGLFSAIYGTSLVLRMSSFDYNTEPATTAKHGLNPKP